MILIIQTVRPTIEIALMQGEELVRREAWVSERDEVKKVLPKIEEMTANEKLDKIIVFNGKGPFSSTRIGVTIANAMAYSLQIPIEQITIENDDSRELTEILQTTQSEEVKIASPVYSHDAKITPSKKPKFT